MSAGRVYAGGVNPAATLPPIDDDAKAAVAAVGLRIDLVDPADDAAATAWVRADLRGFYSDDAEGAEALTKFESFRGRRTTGVYDDSAAVPEIPVATVSSWPTPLTLPGARSVEAWAISSVTVSPTHRRRGIARALLEAELRAAAAHGTALAALTVSEATIYHRFGFACAAFAADWTIDTRRARWTGPDARGRVHFVERADLRTLAPEIEARARLRIPGEVDRWDRLWDSMFGLTPDSAKEAGKLRAVRYDDESGTPQGYAVYRVNDNPDDFSSHPVDVTELVAATDDAYAALWRYLIELDLVSELRVSLRSVDEPVRWMVADARAARKSKESDHLWLRILDVKASLEARRYSAPVNVVLEVADPLGFAEGRFALTADETGVATVAQAGAGDAPDVRLTVNELSALLLGGVSALTLQSAGRVTEVTPGAVVGLDRAFRGDVAPRLGIWF
jgi:predicted acetyltransferase